MHMWRNGVLGINPQLKGLKRPACNRLPRNKTRTRPRARKHIGTQLCQSGGAIGAAQGVGHSCADAFSTAVPAQLRQRQVAGQVSSRGSRPVKSAVVAPVQSPPAAAIAADDCNFIGIPHGTARIARSPGAATWGPEEADIQGMCRREWLWISQRRGEKKHKCLPSRCGGFHRVRRSPVQERQGGPSCLVEPRPRNDPLWQRCIPPPSPQWSVHAKGYGPFLLAGQRPKGQPLPPSPRRLWARCQMFSTSGRLTIQAAGCIPPRDFPPVGGEKRSHCRTTTASLGKTVLHTR